MVATWRGQIHEDSVSVTDGPKGRNSEPGLGFREKALLC